MLLSNSIKTLVRRPKAALSLLIAHYHESADDYIWAARSVKELGSNILTLTLAKTPKTLIVPQPPHGNIMRIFK